MAEHCLFGIILDVVTLQLDKLLESESAQCHTAARVFPAGPCQILVNMVRKNNRSRSDGMLLRCTYRTGKVGTVDKHGTSLDPFNELLRRRNILGPYTGGQAEFAVVHQLHGLVVT